MSIVVREAHSFLARLKLASMRGSSSSADSVFNDIDSRDDERMMSLMNRYKHILSIMVRDNFLFNILN